MWLPCLVCQIKCQNTHLMPSGCIVASCLSMSSILKHGNATCCHVLAQHSNARQTQFALKSKSRMALQTMARLHRSGSSHGDFKPGDVRVGVEGSCSAGASVPVFVDVPGVSVDPIWVSVTFVDMGGSFQGRGQCPMSPQQLSACMLQVHQIAAHTVLSGLMQSMGCLRSRQRPRQIDTWGSFSFDMAALHCLHSQFSRSARVGF